ncbi:hypothetical protein [Actinomadura sp. 6N118]|uniref:hypothetical protein n=1 Tax=Actinomadura sp. 6N118 TaxID=3375151 RepID=UPI0037B97EA0
MTAASSVRHGPKAELEGCVARHARAPLTGAWELDWLPVYAPLDPARIMESTCHRCRVVSYEYLLIGGAFAIRRTDATLGTPKLHETPRVRRKLADQWWAALVSGAAH